MNEVFLYRRELSVLDARLSQSHPGEGARDVVPGPFRLIVAKTKLSAMSWGATVSISLKEVKTGVKVMASASTEMSTGGKVEKDVERFFTKLDKKLDDE